MTEFFFSFRGPIGRYLFLNALANQLRYPNSHTHYFSCVILYLFAEVTQPLIQEQITRYGHNEHDGVTGAYVTSDA